MRQPSLPFYLLLILVLALTAACGSDPVGTKTAQDKPPQEKSEETVTALLTYSSPFKFELSYAKGMTLAKKPDEKVVTIETESRSSRLQIEVLEAKDHP